VGLVPAAPIVLSLLIVSIAAMLRRLRHPQVTSTPMAIEGQASDADVPPVKVAGLPWFWRPYRPPSAEPK